MLKTEYLITGGNSGLAEALIYTISESETIQCFGRKKNRKFNQNVKFNCLDFSETLKDEDLHINISDKSKEIVYINNAAILGRIVNFSELSTTEIKEVYNVNLFNPILFINKLFQISQIYGVKLIIVNITSGLTQYPIDNLTNYIVSKKSMLFFLEVLNLDKANKDVFTFSIDPGMINTNMQFELRKKSHPNSAFFQRKYYENSLRDANSVAKNIFLFLKQEKWKDGETYHIDEIEKII